MAVSLLDIIFGCVLVSILSATENETKQIKSKMKEVDGIEEPMIKKASSYSVETRRRVLKSDLYFDNNKKLWLNPVYGVLANSNTQVYSVTRTKNKHRPNIRQYNNATHYIMSNLYSRISYATTLAVNRNDNKFKSRMRSLPPIPQSRVNRIPSIIYPEILVIVDYSLYKKLNKDIWKTIPYLLAFWNGVDMRFRSLHNPRIRLNIAKILIAEDRWALNYIKSYLNRKVGVNALGALNSKKRWMFDQKKFIPLDSYDMAITMTSHTLYPNAIDEYMNPSMKIKGISFSKSACKIDFRMKHVKKMAIINDLGAFDGILATAHEIGHLLGASHDFGEKDCSATAGFIMNPWLLYKTTSWNWSPCSRSDFLNYLRVGNGTCMYNKPKEGAEIPRYLPGKLINANEQCRILANTTALVINDFICLDINCRSIENSDSSEYLLFGAADGSKCGKDKLCLHGQCLDEKSVI